ncbi:MAG: hypothetical protein AAFQ63_02015 [Cyanobacteria bacterium J06621_11]
MLGKWRRTVCLVGLILIVGGLTSCGVLSQTPPEAIIRLAIVQQLTQTQQSLSQALGLNPDNVNPNFKIESINVQTRNRLADTGIFSAPQIEQNDVDAVYKVQGTFSAKLQAPGYDTASPDSSFEVYLGTNTADLSEVETWFLIPSPKQTTKPS